MSYLKTGVCALALLAFYLPAMAINKCTGADGKVSFQDAPCVGTGELLTVKPASGRAPTASASAGAASEAKRQTDVQRAEASITASINERRLANVQNIFYPQSLHLIDQHRRTCEKEQATLKGGQFAYVQNLYGKTHAAQIASEMAAASARCDLKDRELKEQSEALKSECLNLGGCK